MLVYAKMKQQETVMGKPILSDRAMGYKPQSDRHIDGQTETIKMAGSLATPPLLIVPAKETRPTYFS